MADTFQIEIATPEKLVLQQQAESAQIPGKDGYMGILPGHAALLSELGEGELSMTAGGQDARASTSPAATSRSATITCACWRIRPGKKP